MVTCQQCGGQNLPGMAYCEHCGAPLAQETPQGQGSAPTSSPAAMSPTPSPAAMSPAAMSPTQPPAAMSSGPAAAAMSSGAAAQAAPSIITQPDPAMIDLPQPVMPVDQMPTGPDVTPAPGAAQGIGANGTAANPVHSTADLDEGRVAPPSPASASAVPTTLTVTFPNGQTYMMRDDTVNVGRSDIAQNWRPELDVIPYGGSAPDLGVSRHHARIVRQDGGFAVLDLGSTNGTYVNGHAVPYNQPVALNSGDTLSFGALNTQVSVR